MKNPRQLRSLLAKRITMGQQNAQVELEPQRLDLIEKGHAVTRPLVLRPKEALVPAVPRITEVVDAPSTSGVKPVYVAKKGHPVKTERTTKPPL